MLLDAIRRGSSALLTCPPQALAYIKPCLVNMMKVELHRHAYEMMLPALGEVR